MARGINKVILIGNLGADPEVRYTQGGLAVANASVATTESRKNRDSGESVEKTEWHRVVFFNRLAEIVGEYCKKGTKVYIEGRLQTRKWQDKNGQDRYTTEIIANDMQMLDSRVGSVDGATAPSSNFSRGSAAPTSQNQPAPALDQEFDDDIPF